MSQQYRPLTSELGIEVGVDDLDVSFSLDLIAQQSPHCGWHRFSLDIHIDQDGLSHLGVLHRQILSVYLWTNYKY